MPGKREFLPRRDACSIIVGAIIQVLCLAPTPILRRLIDA